MVLHFFVVFSSLFDRQCYCLLISKYIYLVLYRLFLFVKLVLWRLKRVLNVFDGSISCFLRLILLLGILIFFIVHFTGRGQCDLLRQSHRSGSWVIVELMILPLYDLMIFSILGVQL